MLLNFHYFVLTERMIKFHEASSGFQFVSAGKLRSGLNLIVAMDEDEKRDIELYTVSDENDLHLAARLPALRGTDHLPSLGCVYTGS